MKLKCVLLWVTALVAVSGIWAGRLFWRVRHQLVTLDVREMPLGQVLRSIERQTWTKIRAEKALEARITLHVKNRPLSEVLDRLAEQAGARWSKEYAVYDSTPALERLESALRTDGKLEPVGWLKLAPHFLPPDFEPGKEGGPGPTGTAEPGRGFPMVVRRFKALPGSEPPGVGTGQMPEPPGADGSGPIARRGQFTIDARAKNGPVVFTSGGDGETETWSPEELLMESALASRLGGQTNETATIQAPPRLRTGSKANGRRTWFSRSR